MKKIITIGDIHGRDIWKDITHGDLLDFISWKTSVEEGGDPYSEFWKDLPFWSADRVIFIGDYVDSFDVGDNHMIQNLKDIIFFKKACPDKVVLLLGNHDIQYFIQDQICSGYRPGVAYIFKTLFEDNMEFFQVSHLENFSGEAFGLHTEKVDQQGSVIWTHAGVSHKWIRASLPALKRYGEIYEGFVKKLETPLAEHVHEYLSFLWESRNEVLFWCDADSGGINPVGGPFWIRPGRFNQSRLPFSQVVGHTHKPNVHHVEIPKNVHHWFVDCLDHTSDFLTFLETSPE
jgi:hypothetical protein